MRQSISQCFIWLTLKDEILKTLKVLNIATNIEIATEILRESGVRKSNAVEHRKMQKRIPPILKRLVRDGIVIRTSNEIDKTKTTFSLSAKAAA
jgi:DNA-binding MarR family transcriptional regulator